ncbi:enoyl-CoA hydratase/isomerase family protein [Hoeflea sp.]|uniref:enoyl-CoA hydratase/isomerase family protein n=1 Tax=Hoeflea sp. TaxID=1940281 RepID=UPI003A918D31
MMEDKTVLLETTDQGVAIVTLNRPRAMNAINTDLKIELLDVMRQVSSDPKLKVVVLTGAGRAFCAGGDVKEMGGERTPVERRDTMRNYLHETLLLMHKMEKPVIAAVNGFAVGAGCNLAMAADIILASDEATFAQIFVKVGLVPDAGGFYLLPRLVGMPKAKELVFRGNKIDAREAERIGMVNAVFPAGELMDQAHAMARELAHGPTKAIGIAKTMLNQSAEMNFASALDYEAAVQAIVATTDDHREGVKAFAEKRMPKFGK